MRHSGTLKFLLTDHVGSTSVTADSSGARTAELWYKPWGQSRGTYGATPTTYRFTGQREDASTRLYFFNARYYDAALGRFTQADTIVPQPGDPQSLNRYAYVNNSPVHYTDPSGHSPNCQTCAPNGLMTESPLLNLPDGFNTDPLFDWNWLTSWFENHPGYNPWLDPFVVGAGGWFSAGPFAYGQIAEDWALWQAGQGNTQTVVQAQEAAASVWMQLAPPGSERANSTLRVSASDQQRYLAAALGPAVVETLFHFTNATGYNGIMSSGNIRASTKAASPNDAKYGDGQYFTDIVPGSLRPGQVSRRLFGVPWMGSKLTHYLEVDVSGLEVVQSAANVYLIPGTAPLNVNERIVSHGLVPK